MTNDVLSRVLTLPLKDMDGSLLTHALLKSSSTLGMDKEVVAKSLATASYYHRNAMRSNRAGMPRTHYIEHPLRNALRLVRYGVASQNIIIATILHDVGEDCAREITDDLLGAPPLGASRSAVFMQDTAISYIESEFGEGVAYLVESVTNRPTKGRPTKEEKRAIYVEHVTHAIKSPSVFLVKFSDWVDNAVGLRHNDIEGNTGMISHLAAKYLPLSDIFDTELHSNRKIEALVSPEGFKEMQTQIRAGKKYLSELLEKA